VVRQTQGLAAGAGQGDLRVAAMDLLTLEVDGSLANPYAAAAVVLWTACLSALAIALARGGRTGRHRLGRLVGLFVVGLPITKPAQLLVGNVLYWLADQRITSVVRRSGLPLWFPSA
jgi:hypothetical protein